MLWSGSPGTGEAGDGGAREGRTVTAESTKARPVVSLAAGAAVPGAGLISPAALLAEGATSDAALRQLLHGLPGVDQVGAVQRAAALATRSVKKDAKLWA